MSKNTLIQFCESILIDKFFNILTAFCIVTPLIEIFIKRNNTTTVERKRVDTDKRYEISFFSPVTCCASRQKPHCN